MPDEADALQIIRRFERAIEEDGEVEVILETGSSSMITRYFQNQTDKEVVISTGGYALIRFSHGDCSWWNCIGEKVLLYFNEGETEETTIQNLINSGLTEISKEEWKKWADTTLPKAKRNS